MSEEVLNMSNEGKVILPTKNVLFLQNIYQELEQKRKEIDGNEKKIDS